MRATDVVKKGARLLDSKRPGWEYEIDLEVLDLGSPAKCIVGQLFRGDFTHGCEILFEYEAEEWDEDDVSIHSKYGFEKDSGWRYNKQDVKEMSYGSLDRAWSTFIRTRRAAITR